MQITPISAQSGTRIATVARIVVGMIWIAGAVFNALVTLRMDDPFGWLADGSRFQIWRWYFTEIVGAHPVPWTLLLIAGELALGVLTLASGDRGRLGLAGGAIFSAILFSFGTPYTLMMGPYALLLAWLIRHDAPRSASTGRAHLQHVPPTGHPTGDSRSPVRSEISSRLPMVDHR